MAYKAKLWTADEAAQELAYLATINPVSPGAAFSRDPACFARYANMQVNQMLASGFPLMAHGAAQYRDIASPKYRTIAREAGNYVNGVFVADDYDAWADICAAKPAT
jgi:hypothetical protein